MSGVAGGREPEPTKPGADPHEPGGDDDARRKRVANDPALSPIGPLGGSALSETASEEQGERK
jgi:hypothetical protein